MLLLLGGLEARVAEREAEGVVGELADVGRVEAVALVLALGIQDAEGIALAAQADGERLVLVDRQRAHGAQVDRAGEALGDALGVGGLVDHDRLDDFRRVLVELDRTVVARARLLAAVEERRHEVAAEATDRDVLHATVDALAGDAGQARDRLRDARVRQLADVFLRHDLDQRDLDLLLVECGLDRMAVAGDGDFLERLGRRGLRRGELRATEQRGGDRGRQRIVDRRRAGGLLHFFPPE